MMQCSILAITSMPHAQHAVPPADNDTDAWAPDSWRTRRALQLPQYPDLAALAAVQDELRALPPLVTSWEIQSLKQQLADAQEGSRFLLQGGDCAETFAECNSSVISNRLKVLLQMSLVLVHGLKLPVVRVGRFAASTPSHVRPIPKRSAIPPCRAIAATWSMRRSSPRRRAPRIRGGW